MPTSRTMLTIATYIAAVPVVSAHHSPIAFDGERIVQIQGTVVRFDWNNPHVYIYLTSTEAGGQPVERQIESDWTNDLIRAGWTADSLRPGDQITARVHPARSSRLHYSNLISLQKQDGTILASWDLGEREQQTGIERATGIAGRWLPTQSIPQFFDSTAARVNEAGARAIDSYREIDNPSIQCTPHPLPMRLGMSHVNDIDIRDDRVVITSESDRESRVIFTDGRDHSADGERSLRGHSIGRWEGPVLTVETTLFSEHRRGNGLRIPSGPDKRLTERYEPTPDGSRLRLSYVLEDPEYFVEPVAGEFEWHYAPDFDLIPYSCDLDVARRYLELEQ